MITVTLLDLTTFSLLIKGNKPVMDSIDSAARTSDFLLEAKIKETKYETTNRENPPKQECYFCSEDFPKNDPRLFCDITCSVDFQQLSQRGMV